ncbi:hypothetical protein PVK06_016419 [Gossypium arboreum]|uniref:Uncharacterized protein n=1 Tax=Gossypium arboreum TaxID=29729 RepID=A0ABR0Q084_GOSAR|nr:hypothetical protein PVK06_016419 [Gossypium arboreum]
MAMVGGGGLVEAYVMLSLCKEKMKEMEKRETKTDDNKVFVIEKEVTTTGCFFWVSKKTRSSKCYRSTFLQNPGPCAHGVGVHLSAASVLVARWFTVPNALVWVFSGLLAEACYARFGVVIVSIVGRTMVSGFYALMLLSLAFRNLMVTSFMPSCLCFIPVCAYAYNIFLHLGNI